MAVDLNLQLVDLLGGIIEAFIGSEMIMNNLGLVRSIMEETGFSEIKRGALGYPFIHFLTGKLRHYEI